MGPPGGRASGRLEMGVRAPPGARTKFGTSAVKSRVQRNATTSRCLTPGGSWKHAPIKYGASGSTTQWETGLH